MCIQHVQDVYVSARILISRMHVCGGVGTNSLSDVSVRLNVIISH